MRSLTTLSLLLASTASVMSAEIKGSSRIDGVTVYPAGAERLGPEEGAPPAIAVYRGDQIVAYLFSTLDIIGARGYSATPPFRPTSPLAGHATRVLACGCITRMGGLHESVGSQV